MASQLFGSSVALGGDIAFVGAPGETDQTFQQAGKLYMFRKTSTTLSYTLQTSVGFSDADSFNYFGASVATNGDGPANVIGVGIPNMDFTTPALPILDAGAVQVFSRTNNAFTETSRLFSPYPSANAKFGKSFAFGGNGTGPAGAFGLIIGEPKSGSGGAAHLFQRGANNSYSIIRSANGTANSLFGSWVAINPDASTIAIGAPYANGSTVKGEVVLFAGDLTGRKSVSASDGSPGDMFGYSVAVRKGVMVVGAPGKNAAYVFTMGSSGWTESQILTIPNLASYSQFGSAVVISGDETTILVGAPGEGTMSTYGFGGVYIFQKAAGASTFTNTGKLEAGDRGYATLNNQFGAVIDISGTVAVIGVPTSNDKAFASGAFYASQVSCVAGTYGDKCATCQCINGQCYDGIRGNGQCLQCNPGYHGLLCESNCTCMAGTCDDNVNGTGFCVSCTSGNYGINCENNCLCQNGGICSEGITGNGSCTCGALQFGNLCEMQCACPNGVCNKTDGSCVSCNSGFYGAMCQPCTCMNGVCDDTLSGAGICLNCEKGWTGLTCNETCGCTPDNLCTIYNECICVGNKELQPDGKSCAVPSGPSAVQAVPTWGWVVAVGGLVLFAVILAVIIFVCYLKRKGRGVQKA